MKTVKRINVDLDKCIGCRACEMACSGFHAVPRFSSTNPARSRIRVVVDDRKDVYVPIRAGEYTQAECSGRNTYTVDGKDYKGCSFCRASCKARDLFKEPDSGLPLTCDMCASDPPLAEPMCVQVCRVDALTYEEWEEEVAREDVKRSEIETALEDLIGKYGLSTVLQRVGQMSGSPKR